jgi:CheY-like chemotaxis protein
MSSAGDLRGQHLLIVEDEYFLAEDLAHYFHNLGAKVVGPVASVADALTVLRCAEVDGAVLDVNLRGERVYPVAEVLRQRGVPFVFASGYGGEFEPAEYAAVPRCVKPVDFAVLARALIDEIGRRRAPKLRNCKP